MNTSRNVFPHTFIVISQASINVDLQCHRRYPQGCLSPGLCEYRHRQSSRHLKNPDQPGIFEALRQEEWVPFMGKMILTQKARERDIGTL